MQDCIKSTVLAIELLQSCAKPPIYSCTTTFVMLIHIKHIKLHLVNNSLFFENYPQEHRDMQHAVYTHISLSFFHDDVIQWKYFPRYWPFVRGIHRSSVNSPHKRPVTRSFDVFFDLHPNKRLSKHLWRWWFEPPSRPLWRHCNVWRLNSRKTPHSSPVRLRYVISFMSAGKVWPTFYHFNCWVVPSIA